MEHAFNMNEDVVYPIVKNWESIYDIVTSPIRDVYMPLVELAIKRHGEAA